MTVSSCFRFSTLGNKTLSLLLLLGTSASAYQFQMRAASSSPSLKRVASYAIQKSPASKSFFLVVSHGSVVDFSYDDNPQSCSIVNAANEGCLGGGGVDGAITAAGGPNLAEDRLALPIVSPAGIRCPTGKAKITGPNQYGQLHVPYVIHAVGPNYWNFEGKESKADKLLRSAYKTSLELAKEHRIEAVGFSLISSGAFKGNRSKKHVMKIALQAVKDFEGYDDLKEVHLCAFSEVECDRLEEIVSDVGLEMNMTRPR